MKDKMFSGVQETMYIPLAARVAISQRFPEYFYDEKSMQFKNIVQVKAINAKSSEYTAIASVARYYNMDRFVESFLRRYPEGNIVNLGVGLETMNYRIDCPKALFYNVDYPTVIDLREKMFGKAENEIQIRSDINKMTWI